jgi:hypothetical protein
MTFRPKDIVTRIVPATKILQSKANKGSVDSVAVETAQVVIDETIPVDDISPYFDDHCTEVADVIERSKGQKDFEDLLEELSSSFANYRSALIMSNNVGVSKIVSEIFFLIEGIDEIDEDIISILEKYILTMKSIAKMSPPPQDILGSIELEIKAVISRYSLKHPGVVIESAFENEEIEN